MWNKTEIDTFVTDCVVQNVRVVSRLADLAYEVDRLAASLTSDARALGISGGDIYKTVGDIDDYLTEQYHRQSGATPAQ
jgi:hypothetical protein